VKILLAEDELAGRALLNTQLKRLGYETVVAEDGRLAWEQFEREPVEVVITDLMMPHMDGLELCRRIRAIERPPFYTYVMMLTSLDGKEWALQGIAAGADDFVTKPATFDELVIRLRVAEHTLHLERGMRRLESLLGGCVECHRVPTPDGRRISMRSYLTEVAPRDERVPCPDCRLRDAHVSAASSEPCRA
jgi:DNA-binding response OmpR family regulator